MAEFRGGYEPDARFLDEDEQVDLRRAQGAFQQRSSPDVREDNARRRALSAKAAGEYRKRQGYSQPNLGGRISVGKFVLDSSPFGGTELPSLRGRNYGRPGAGGMMYADKPDAAFGTFYGFS